MTGVEVIADIAQLRLKLITRHNEGWSIRQLSRHYGISRNRVRRILRSAHKRRTEPPPALPATESIHRNRGSQLDEFVPAMRTILQRYPRISGVRMLEELRQEGYRGGITILRERLNQLRPQPSREGSIRFETDPGVQGQMDWSPYRLDFTRTGKTDVLCFSYILGFSRRQYVDFVLARDFHTLIRRHRDAFEHFGGVARQCLYDSEKTVVLRWEANQPVFNPSFIDFITHYRCRPIACSRGAPRTKGKIERPFQYVEGNLLNGRTFADLEDLRAVARWWMKERSDTHIHETTHHAPLELFMSRERGCLQPLPTQPYDCAEVVFRVCVADAFVDFETNRYSVPFGHVGEILALKATEHDIYIYSPYLDLLAHHPRHPNGACRIEEVSEHHTRSSLRYGIEPVREAFERIGDAAPEFLAGLRHAHPRSAGLHARMILQLKQRYLTDDIARALQHALRYCAFDAASIERILKARAPERTLEAQLREHAGETLAKLMPPVKQRSLEEYQGIFKPGKHDGQQCGDCQQNQKSLPNSQAQDDSEQA